MADQKRGSRTIDKMLSSKTSKMTGSTSTILFALFWKIVFSVTGGNTDRWNRNMRAFLEDPLNGVPNNDRERSSARGNINKEFSRNTMSWKVFCKGIRFLQISKFELVIKAHHPNGVVSEHSTMVHLQRLDPFEDLQEDLQDGK
jgi:hypothetical protein